MPQILNRREGTPDGEGAILKVYLVCNSDMYFVNLYGIFSTKEAALDKIVALGMPYLDVTEVEVDGDLALNPKASKGWPQDAPYIDL